jgi:alpha-L-fucosidase 2
MGTTRREFFLSTATAAAAVAAADQPGLDGAGIASRHKIVRTQPTPDFFEGMLLGNGDIGVCVTVRPDAIGLHIGKSDSWDIRVSEDHAKDVLTFAELLKLWERASEEAKRLGKPDMLYLEQEIPFFREYTGKVTASYAKSWPRPWPCGILWVHWDVPRFRVVRQELDPANGHFTLELNEAGKTVRLHCFVNTLTGHVCLWSDEPASFSSVAFYPNIDEPAGLPKPELQSATRPTAAEFECVQVFPATAPTAQVPNPPPSPKDRSFAMHGVVHGEWDSADSTSGPHVLFTSRGPQALRVDVALFTPRDHAGPGNTRPTRRSGSRASRLATFSGPRTNSGDPSGRGPPSSCRTRNSSASGITTSTGSPVVSAKAK